jgi:hypothetical protein
MGLLDTVSKIGIGKFFVVGSDIIEAGIKTAKGSPKGVVALGFGLNVAAQAGLARKGHVVKDSGSAALGELGSAGGGVIGGLLPIPGGSVIGSLTGYTIANSIGRSVIGSAMTAGQSINHLNVGGNYKDTEVAYTMRQRAAQEMSGSLLNARMYLGAEGWMQHG